MPDAVNSFGRAQQPWPDLFLARRYPVLMRNVAHPTESGRRQFVDVTTATGLAAIPQVSGVWMGAFGDYDGDSRVDLYLARANQDAVDPDPDDFVGDELDDVLLRNNTWANGKFQVANATFVHDTDPLCQQGQCNVPMSATASISVAWGDVDNDGRQDFVVGNYNDSDSGHWTRVYRNQGLVNGTWRFMHSGNYQDEHAVGRVGAVKLVDLDGDGWLDLLLARQDEMGVSPLQCFLNDGTGHFLPGSALGFSIQEAMGLRALAVQDMDLNGVLDVAAALAEGAAPTTPNPVFFGFGSGGVVGFLRGSEEVALDPGPSTTVTLSDFNRDGDADLFLGRIAAGADDFYYYSDPDPEIAGHSQNYLQVYVHAPANAGRYDAMAIGTRVQVTVPGTGLQQAQMIEGGSGRGTQEPRLLTFGLGSSSPSQAQVEVRYPDGDVANLNGPASGNLLTVNPPPVKIWAGSLTTTVILSGASVTGTVKWETDRPTTGNVVTFAGGSGGACGSCPVSCSWTATSVQVGPNRWRHTATKTWSCVAPCSYNFSVRSWDGGTDVVSSGHTMMVTFCGNFEE